MKTPKRAALALVCAAFLAAFAPLSVPGTALAESGAAETGLGPVTSMPLPRFVSLKASEGNARRGPGLSHRIDWVFRHRDMPLLITAEFENWRRVEDRDGQGGWIHYTLLSGVRTVTVTAELAELHDSPEADSPVTAKADAGVIGRLGTCQPDWCRIAAGGEKGWVRKSDIWGVMPGEVRE